MISGSRRPVCILYNALPPFIVEEQREGEGKLPASGFWREVYTVLSCWELDLVIELEIVA